MNNYQFRPATIADTELITYQRIEMFADMGMDRDLLNKTHENYKPWLAERLSNGIYQGILVECEGQVIAGAGYWIMQGAPLPNLDSADMRRASIVNVFTEPDYRRQGLARQLMDRLLEQIKSQNIPVVLLHASDKGRPLYESMGFKNTNEFRLM